MGNGAQCNRRGRARLEDGERPKRYFDVLEVTMNSKEDFSVLKAGVQNGAAKQASTIVKKMPKKSPQTKAKQENRTNGEVVRVGRTVPKFTKVGPSGKGEMLSRGGSHCHPLLGVVADDNDDRLFTERAKELREICMKEKAGNCEHRKLYHDWPMCALPQQTGSHWRGWMPGWQYLALTVIPHMLVQDHAIQDGCIAQRLELRVSHRRPRPEPPGTETATLDTRKKLEGNDVSGGTSGSGTRLGQANVQLWKNGGVRRRRLLRAERVSEMDERRKCELHHGLVGDAK